MLLVSVIVYSCVLISYLLYILKCILFALRSQIIYVELSSINFCFGKLEVYCFILQESEEREKTDSQNNVQALEE